LSDGLVAAVDKNNALQVDLLGFNVRSFIIQDRNVVDDDDDMYDNDDDSDDDLRTEIECIENI
jgi:hypothetical protein